MIDYQQLIPSLIPLAQRASKEILSIYRQSQQYPIQTKADHSPLTQADLISHSILTTGLQELTPTIPILSEESSAIPWQERKSWEQYWLLDPLDGTLPFIQHRDEFSINIALIKNHLPILGMIYIPITEECYYAHTLGGAHKVDAQGHTQQLGIRPWQTGQTTLLASRGASEERLAKRFIHLGEYTLVRMSSAWKFCWLAEGKADISPRFGDTSEWDTAAGQCILEQAGGAILDLNGNPLRYNTHDSLLNPHFIALGDLNRIKPILPWGKWPELNN